MKDYKWAPDSAAQGMEKLFEDGDFYGYAADKVVEHDLMVKVVLHASTGLGKMLVVVPEQEWRWWVERIQSTLNDIGYPYKQMFNAGQFYIFDSRWKLVTNNKYKKWFWKALIKLHIWDPLLDAEPVADLLVVGDGDPQRINGLVLDDLAWKAGSNHPFIAYAITRLKDRGMIKIDHS